MRFLSKGVNSYVPVNICVNVGEVQTVASEKKQKGCQESKA